METLIESIAKDVGPKWTQLYSHLRLGPRDRYRFQSDHQGEPEHVKQRSCARDCMKLWRSSLAGGVEEGEAMGRLLVALRKVQGFAELAEQLAQRNGIVLDPPPPPQPQALLPAPVVLPPHPQSVSSALHYQPPQHAELPPRQTQQGFIASYEEHGAVRSPHQTQEMLPHLPSPPAPSPASHGQTPVYAPASHVQLPTHSPASHGQTPVYTPASHGQLLAHSRASHGHTPTHTPASHVQLPAHTPASHVQLPTHSPASHGQTSVYSPASHVQSLVFSPASHGQTPVYPPSQPHHRVTEGSSSSGSVVPEAMSGQQGPEDEEQLELSPQLLDRVSVSQEHEDSFSDSDPLHSETHSEQLHHDLYLPDVEQLLRCPIDLTQRRHKFALLDLAQRLAPDKWHGIATRLELPDPVLQKIKIERQLEEKYYKILKQWVSTKKMEATFATLRDVLESYEQFAAVDVMVRRLKSTGMTLTD